MKLSVKVILITFINTMFLNCIITSNVLMHLFPRNAYIISFLLGIFVTLLYLIIPTKNTNFQTKVLNSKFGSFGDKDKKIASSKEVLPLSFAPTKTLIREKPSISIKSKTLKFFIVIF